MLILLGEKLYGKVDQAPGLFYVKTTFFHVNYFPLLPLESFIVVEGAEPPFLGAGKTKKEAFMVSTEFSLKSVAVCWLRLVLGCFVLVSCIVAVLMLFNFWDVNHPLSKTPVLALLVTWPIAGAFLFVLWLSFRLTCASYGRAVELAGQLGMPLEMLQKRYGRLATDAPENESEAVNGNLPPGKE